MEKKRLPLEGIRVLSVGWYGAEPITAMTLGHYGAEVIRVESITKLDQLRLIPPMAQGGTPGLNISGCWNMYNSDKMGITLNLKTEKGLEIFKKLVSISDIVTDNWAGDAMETTGISYDELVKIKPDIITCSLPVFGNEGPQRNYRGHGMQNEAAGGIAYITGFPGRSPVGSCMYYPDFGCNPFHAIFAILTALRYRDLTGKGQRIEVPQVQCTVAVLETTMLDYTVNGRIAGPQGNRLSHAAPHGAYRCKGENRACFYSSDAGPIFSRKFDRWCVIAVFTDEEWTALCNVMGNPPWTEDPRFATLLGRKGNEDELDRLVEEWTMERSAEEVMLLLQQAGVPAGVVQDGEDLVDRDPQLRARGYWVYLDHPEAGVTASHGCAERLSKTPPQIRLPAPCIGQHNEYILKEYLGYNDEEVTQLVIDGVIQ